MSAPSDNRAAPGTDAVLADRMKLVKPLWRAGVPGREIVARTGLTQHQLNWLVRKHPKELPSRGRGRSLLAGTRRVPAPSAGRQPAEPDVRRDPPAKADAFRPLPGTRPALLWQSCGCHWPVHVDGADPMQNTTLFVCDAAPAIKGRTQDGSPIPAPYCAAHVAMAQGETEWRQKREARDARRAA